MSLPRPYRANTTYLLTRRTSERRFFLNPDPKTAISLLFSLGWYAVTHEIKLHAFVFMSNHVHLVVTDMHGNLPDFTRDFYASVARVMNAKMERKENFWASGRGGVKELGDEKSIVDAITYVLTNPVAAGIVPTHTQWRLNSTSSKVPLVSTLGTIKRRRRRRISRPRNYFKKKGGAVGDYTVLVLKSPPCMDEEQYHHELESCVKKREQNLQESQKVEKKPFLGMTNAMKIDPQFKPATEGKKSKGNPLLAYSNPEQLIEAKIRLKEFRRAYKQCLALIQEGKKEIPFPEGTYGMRRLYGVKTAPLEYVLRELSSA